MIGGYRDDMKKHCFTYCGDGICDCSMARPISDKPEPKPEDEIDEVVTYMKDTYGDLGTDHSLD